MGLLESRQKQLLAQGWPGTNSKRQDQYPQGAPQYFVKGESCYLYDLEGNKYVDFVASLGPAILGHAHPKVNEAIKKQLDRGVLYALPSPLEIEVAEMIQEMVPDMERIRFLKTGSEACSAAVRIARAFNGSESLVYSDGYHGWHDAFTRLTEPALGVPKHWPIHAYDNTERFSKESEEINTLIIEPVQLDVSDNHKKWLDFQMNGVNVNIFDEVITGFRVPKWSVARWWGLKPDMVILGKAIANGMPLAVVGGKKDVMNCGEYFISSTYSGELASLAAAKATMEEIRKQDMNELWLYANRFMRNLNDILSDIDVHVEGYGTRGMFRVEQEKTALFVQQMIKSGVFFGKAFFYTFAHLEEGIDEWILNLASDVVNRIRHNKVELEGEPPKPTFKR